MSRDLNKLSTRFFHGHHFGTRLPNGAFYTNEPLRDYSVRCTAVETVSVHFSNIHEVYVSLARRHEVVVGAVAWLTNFEILEALSGAKGIGIVVQKEDFLRRDCSSADYSSWKSALHHRYNALKPISLEGDCNFYPGVMEDDPDYNSAVQHWLFDQSGLFQRGGLPVRCLGYSGSKSELLPRMHHKFLIFGDAAEGLIMRPRRVVTGSFNLTSNGTRSRENIVEIADPRVCHAYLSEWSQLWCLSEPPDWSSSEPVTEELDMST